MSVLRISRPGHPTEFVDLGPGGAVRRSGHVGGEAVSSRSVGFTAQKVVTVPSRAAERPEVARCGHRLRLLGVPCHRPIHDGTDHRSEAQMARQAAKRRKP